MISRITGWIIQKQKQWVARVLLTDIEMKVKLQFLFWIYVSSELREPTINKRYKWLTILSRETARKDGR